MRLSGYFNKLQNYIADCKEYRRQVDRERSMVCGGNIVLKEEFEKCFYIPLQNSRRRSLYDHLWHDDPNEVFHHFLKKDMKEGLAQFYIPLNCLTEEGKKTFQEHYKLESEALIKFIEQSGQDVPSETKESLTSIPSHAIGYRLGTLLEIADNVWTGLGKCDRHTVWTGHGQTAVDFWKSVNALDDYSHLFPNRPPGPGKKARDREKAKSPLWGWKPSFNN